MILLFAIANFKEVYTFDYISILLLFVGVVSYILTMLVLNWMTKKNDLTKKTTHTILLFAFLTVMLPSALTNPLIMLSNLFLILGIRSILLLRYGKRIKANIFDASLWIGLASLAYFWSIGFIIVLYLGILLFEPKNYRNWMIPILSMGAIYILANMFTLVVYDSYFSVLDYVDTISLSYSSLLSRNTIFSIGTILICTLFFFSIYVAKFNRKSTKAKPVLKLIIAQLLVAILIVAIAPEKNTAEMIFIASPLAIIGTSYLEMDQNELIKEINIWVFLGMPFMALLF